KVEATKWHVVGPKAEAWPTKCKPVVHKAQAGPVPVLLLEVEMLDGD
ncbi:hypothetical protein A2U01_0069767, partial [Trifolium medium]|nr:hypothetical protein [Trifolium medium]